MNSVWAPAVIFVACVGSANAESWKITTRGYGPVGPGTSVSRAQTLLGTKLRTSNGEPMNEDCVFLVARRGHKGLSLMVQNGKVTHVEADRRGIATRAGIRVGDSDARVKALYRGQLHIEPHFYGDGFYFFVLEKNKKYGMKFEIVGGKVVAIYGGSETIYLVEGCS